jgi:hypothetical protein
MIAPDTNTVVILVSNIIGFFVVEWRLNKRAVEREAVRNYQHEKVWRWYEKAHGINGHSEVK